jgi:hypothetical protein
MLDGRPSVRRDRADAESITRVRPGKQKMNLDSDAKIDLSGRLAIVTGGARGIGKAIALELAAAVASVPVVARSADQLAETVCELKILEPGTVRKTMAEHALRSAEGRQWLPWFPAIFARGDDVLPKHAASLVVALASGRADELSGRFFTVKDNIEGLAERARVGGLGDSQTLRLVPPA